MLVAKVFKSGNSFAIRIPKQVTLKDREYVIKKQGTNLYLTPIDDPWYLVRRGLGIAKDEPELKRNQPLISDLPKREEFDVLN